MWIGEVGDKGVHGDEKERGPLPHSVENPASESFSVEEQVFHALNVVGRIVFQEL